MDRTNFIRNLGTEIDLRKVAAGERTETLLGAYRGLEPDSGFVLVDERDPAVYLNLLQSLHPGEFDWIPITIQPRRWRVGLSRRDRRAAGPRRVVQFMTEDHLRLSLLLRHICRLVDQDATPEASRACGFLTTILARHIKVEEEVLFAVFSRAPLELPEWHAEDLHAEHRDVLARAQRLRQILGGGAGNGGLSQDLKQEVSRLAPALEQEFTRHATKEERLLYNWVDMVLEPPQVDDLILRIQAVQSATPPL